MKKGSEQRKLFGTNGVRGIVNKELTPELILKLSMATGTYFKGADLAVGCDGRVSSPMFLDIVSSGLASVGCQVWNLGAVTTPTLQFVVKDWDLEGGIMVTASHNPPEYNGIKVMGGQGVEIPYSEEYKIEQIYFGMKWRFSNWKNVKQPVSVAEKFEAYIRSVIDNSNGSLGQAKLRVLVDAANGVSGLVTPQTLRELGCSVTMLNGDLDGTFPGRNPEPTPANLRETCRVVRSAHVDFGVAHDGDGDRAVFLDDRGAVYWGDQTFALVVKDYLEHHPGRKIVTPISSSQMIDDIAEKYGSEVIYTPVGSVYVSNLMLKINAKLGGEENGGIFYEPHVAARDGTFAAAIICRIVAEARKPLSKLVAELPRYYIIKDKISCPHAIKAKVTEEIRRLPTKHRVLAIDGIKVWIPPRSWILIRPSGTEPIFRIMAEAPTKGMATRIVSGYKKRLSHIIKSCQRYG